MFVFLFFPFFLLIFFLKSSGTSRSWDNSPGLSTFLLFGSLASKVPESSSGITRTLTPEPPTFMNQIFDFEGPPSGCGLLPPEQRKGHGESSLSRRLSSGSSLRKGEHSQKTENRWGEKRGYGGIGGGSFRKAVTPPTYCALMGWLSFLLLLSLLCRSGIKVFNL